jgi:sugar/nucleoside kinase (ribokinase family)
MKTVAIIGGTTFDHIITLKQLPQPIPTTIHSAPFHEGTGSTGAGKALALTKLGVSNTLYSVIGDDHYGQYIIQDLENNGVDFIYDIDPKGTERHINIMDENGGRISIFITTSSEVIDTPDKKMESILATADIIVLNIISYCKSFIPQIVEAQKPIWTDLHDYDGSNAYHQPFIDAAQYIHLSSDNLTDYKSTMQSFINQGKELVICTHGKAGASLLTKHGIWLEQPGIANLPIIDANGAGDNFFAGFLVGWMNNLPLQTCLQYAAICGGYCVTSKGLVYEQLTPAFLKQQHKVHFS